MPLNGIAKTLNKAGESRKPTTSREGPFNTSSRDHSQHRGPSTHDPVPLRGQENAFGQTINNEAALRASLAVNVPNTMKGQPSQSSDDEKENDEPYQQYVKPEPGFGPLRSRQSQYDYMQEDDNNNTSMTFGSKGWEPDPDTYAHATTIFRGDPLAAVNSPGLRSEAQRAKEARSKPQRMNQSSSRPQQGRQPAVYDADEYPASEDDEGFDGFEDAEEARLLARDTPSRTTVAAVRTAPSRSNLTHEKKVGFADLARGERSSSPITNDPDYGALAQIAGSELPQPEVHAHSSLARHIQTREEVKQMPAPEPLLRPVPVNINPTAKVSSFDDPPQDELPNPFQPGLASTATKRTHNEIDYDPAELNSKTYTALDEVPFLTDPRAPTLQAQVDATGNPLPTLSARLNNLLKMRPEDQKNLFLSLTDAENEQTGQFFIESFSDNLKKLMRKRLERRKIALKFELEARKRQKAIERKQKQCEDELGELKNGGHKLVDGRSVDRIGMTPRKPQAGVAGMMPPAAMH